MDPTDGAKVAVVVGGPDLVAGTRYYLVKVASGEELFYAGDELVKRPVDLDSPVTWLTERSLVDPDRLARMVTHLKLTTGLTDVVYSFSSTRTLFRVHQFKPVLKVIDSPSHRLLLADEVGLGKTIEAGLVWAEIDARSPTQRVLVLCPGGLRRKWQAELHRRFDKDVPIVDRSDFLRFLDLYQDRGDAARFTGIASFSQLRHDTVLKALSEKPPTFDMVIIDEAHAMRNTGTKTHQLGELLAQNCEALLLLSATPVNLGSNDLFNLLRLLRPEEYDDPFAFADQLEPNEFVNRAGRILRSGFPPDPDAVATELQRVETTSQAERFRRNPIYRELLDRLRRDGPLGHREVADVQRDLAGLNTLASLYTRTRKRDLKDQTAVRRARTLEVELRPEELVAYQAVTRLVAALRQRVQGVAPGLAAVMPARQASSCLPAMTKYLDRLEAEGRAVLDLDEAEEIDDLELDDESAAADLEETDLVTFAGIRAACARAADMDTKFEVLAGELARIRRDSLGKTLIFATFILTLEHLHRRLSACGYQCRVMTGGTPMRDRDRLIDDFRNGDIDILLCSEIGSEGLDFEFCNVIVNYDLPWNPMRLEQRIGRLDRFGQTSPVIHILNFNIPGTIDTEIFLRLYNRIGVFERSIGELEPILGERLRELTVAMAKSQLTLEEQRRVADQVALAVESERREIESFEEVRDRLVGADAYVEDALEEAFTDRRFLTADEMERYVAGFLREEASPARLEEAGAVKALLGSPALAEHLRTHGSRLASPDFLQLVTTLESGGAVPVTFDSSAAYGRQAEFVNLRHPLCRTVASFYEAAAGRLHPGGYAQVPSARYSGSWIFYLFLFSATGLVARRALYAVAWNRADGEIDSEVGQEVLTYLAGPGPVRMQERHIPILDPDEAASAYEAVMETVALARVTQQQELQQRNAALVSTRQESLRHGTEIRVRRLREMAAQQAEESPIRRMRLAQAGNLEQRTATQIADLEKQRSVSLGFKVVAGGLADFVPMEP